MSLVIALGVVKNPHQYETVRLTWWWGTGFLSLVYLAYVEKQPRFPFRFIDRLEWKWDDNPFYLFGMALGLTFIISYTLAFVLGQAGLPAYYIVVHSGNDVFGIIGFASTIAISEESFKVAFTNLFTRVCGVREKSTERLIVMFFGTVGVSLWAYLHILIGGHNLSYAAIVFCVGIVYFLMICYAKNYLPTTAAHAVWNMALDLGFLP